jgi:lysozyme
MAINPKALEIIKKYEGFRSKAYLCPAGTPTIGFGSTVIDNTPVKLGDVITAEQAEKALETNVSYIQARISQLVKVPLTGNQLAALTSFAYNVGLGAFTDSTLLRLLNKKRYNEAAFQFLRWVYANGKVLPGLVSRRKAEKDLFCE